MKTRRKSKEFPRSLDLLVFDFDGVITDNRVLITSDGKEAVLCSRSDGLGISLLKQNGVRMIVVSTETNPIVEARCKKLEIECFQGVKEKSEFLKNEVKKRGLSLENTIFVGNDVNDMSAMEIVGYSVGVADSHPDIIEKADMILSSRGGQGAVRELADLILGKIKNGKIR